MKTHIRPLMMLFATILLVFMTGLSAAQAASPHFKKGGTPVCTVTYSDGGRTATTTCKFVLAGLGNEDLVATVSVSGSAVYQCQNQGGNVAPGQNKVLVGPATVATPVASPDIKNGTLKLTTLPVVLTAPSTVSGAAAGCPNNNWTGINPVVTVTSITLTIDQPEGTRIFTCGASDTDGLTSPVTLSC